MNTLKLFLIQAAVWGMLMPAGAQTKSGAALYQQHCAQCHGAEMQGGNAQSLVDGIWQFGAEDGYVTRNIKFGITHLGMPAYEKTLNDAEIRSLVQYIRESEKNAGAVKPAVTRETGTLYYDLKIEEWVRNLEIPWAIDFIGADTALVTERP